MPRRRENFIVFSRVVAALAAVMIVGVFAGCMSFNIGRTTNRVTSDSVGEDGVLVQEGVARIKGGGDTEVHYPVSYQKPPNLELVEDGDHCEIVEQHEDHFRIRNSSPFKAEPKWKARGVKVPAAVPVGPAPATSTSPPPDPPPPDTPPSDAPRQSK
jgi:hypothetical protein